MDALHLFGHLLGLNFDFDKTTREDSHLVEGTFEARKTDSRVDLLAISHDDDPFVWLTLHTLRHDEGVDVLAKLVHKVQGN